ncbi:tumor suppressor, Mitostatin-domain-containing protein [Tribonema minus]|uniref:Meiosis-specific nuclear structural protein 1 n=1 Tax=Tribonema minus TaxID=303371 RepID=A0A835Z6N9_9STRA|nr:tumor suppressor, Mitostatin-domain-containing protein [Tribonema minus]
MTTGKQPRMTAAYVDQLMVQRRVDERSHNDLRRYNHEVNILSHAAANEQRMTFQRRANESARFAAEQMMEEQIEAQEDAQRTHERLQDQNSRLAEEIQRRRAEPLEGPCQRPPAAMRSHYLIDKCTVLNMRQTVRREVEVQRICSESDELRGLEQTLKLAYLNRERAAQYEEKQLVRRLQEDVEQAIADKMEHDRQEALRAEAMKAALRRDMAAEQRESLQKQVDERQQLMEEAARVYLTAVSCAHNMTQEAERDRQMVAAIVAAVEREDRDEAMALSAKRDATRAMVREAEENRQHELERRLREEAAQEEDIRRHQERLAARQAQVEAERKRKKEVADANFRAVVESTEKQRCEEEELRLLRDMLWEEELAAKREADDRERARKAEENKAEMMRAHHEQLKQRERRREAEAAVEAQRVSDMMAKFRADEEREKVALEQRERAKAHHRDSIQAQRLERERLYNMERQQELQELEKEKEREEYKKMVVAEARKRLLEQHAAALEGYLPKGAVKSAEELEYVRKLAAQQRSTAPYGQPQSAVAAMSASDRGRA